MAITTTELEINGNEQVFPFWSENTELTLAYPHILIEGLTNFPITFKFYQGNIPNMLAPDTNEITGSDVMVAMRDCEDAELIIPITANGVYFVAADFFFGKWGEMRIEANTNTSGTIKAIINTVKKIG